MDDESRRRETEFALIFGQMMGYLTRKDIVQYLLDHDVPEYEIDGLRTLLSKVSKAFYL